MWWGTSRVDPVAPVSLLGQATARFVGIRRNLAQGWPSTGTTEAGSADESAVRTIVPLARNESAIRI
jgi:hypothetical protein